VRGQLHTPTTLHSEGADSTVGVDVVLWWTLGGL